MFIFSKSNNPDTDKELISKFRNSYDNSYIEELFSRYTHLVYSVCYKYLKHEEDSKDAVMEIFEQLIENLKKHQIENFKGWIYSVARNHSLMKLRKEKKIVEFDTDFDNFKVKDVELNNNLHLDNEEKVNKMMEGLNQLKNEQKKCVELFYLQEKCYREVVEVTGYSLKQVKSFIQNGKRNLKNYMVENHG
ncbi:MAG: sigma-70 family RNA polymerase sigma factor [Bacteroidetes bacterium]|nr:sigma-70 family RNA polymerase sigma factor [Bacteroidota bacterium]